MATDLVKTDHQLINYTSDQVELIRKQIAPKATADELKLFLYQCQRTGLDALSRQICCIHLGGKMTIQTSIDGFRVIAERSGSYAGQDEPAWEEDAKGKPVKCTVKVYRFNFGQRYCAGVGVAYWSEYAQQGPMWTKMPHTMLAKCAEALALRKAFPADLSGLYSIEEMQQAQGDEDAGPKKISIKEATAQMEEIKTAIKDLLDCKNIDDLKKLKEQLPGFVRTNQSFHDAATQRFQELNKVVEEAEVVD